MQIVVNIKASLRAKRQKSFLQQLIQCDLKAMKAEFRRLSEMCIGITLNR